MKAIVSILLCALIFISGCTHWIPFKTKVDTVKKPFYGRSIVYKVDVEARSYMDKITRLLGQAHDMEYPMPDNMTVCVYRDTDMDRDHSISLEEATQYYYDIILKFEDSLGSVKIKPAFAKVDRG